MEIIPGSNPTSPVAGSPSPEPDGPTAQQAVAGQEQQVAPPAGGPPTTAVGEDAIDASIEASAAPPSDAGWQNFRSSYQRRKEELTQLRTELETLKSKPQTENLLPIDAPAEDWDVGSRLDNMRDTAAPYYNRLGWEIITRHLPDVLPILMDKPENLEPELQTLLQQSATRMLEVYSGLTSDQLVDAISRYKGAPAPASQPTATYGASGLDQYGLDPYDPRHAAFMNQYSALDKQVKSLQDQINHFTETEKQRTVSSADERLSKTIDASRTTMLEKIQVPPGYDWVKSDIERSAMWEFERDPIVQAAKGNAKRYFLQGTPDISMAAAEISRLQTQLDKHIQDAAQRLLAPVVEVERHKTLTSQQQAGVHNIPSGAGTVSSVTNSNKVPIKNSEDAVQAVLARFRAAQIKPQA